MLNEAELSLYQYRQQYQRSFRLSSWLADGAANAFVHSGGRSGDIFRAVKLITFGMAAIAADTAETKKTKKRLCAILRCPQEEIAMDINELVQKRERTKYYGGDFTYSAATPKKWLEQIQIIFGDAHLEALDDMSCLGRLRSVWGSFYVSRCTDLSGLNLTIIKGDLHGEKLERANGLDRLEFVGGKIFYQDKEFLSLKECRSFLQI